MREEEASKFLAAASLLTFGVGATIGEPPNMHAMPGGSGVFIAPFLAITVRHVSRKFFDLEGGDPGFTTDTYPASHSPFLFQVLDPTSPSSRRGLWHVDRSRDFIHTDLCLMQVSAEEGAALAMQHSASQQFHEIRLLPPPIGATVQAVGYPRLAVQTDGSRLLIDTPATFSEGVVRAVHSPFLDREEVSFPCFEVEMWADHGFSGGPVFHEGKLCGLVSSGILAANRIFVAALWPLLRANVDFGLGKSPLIRELFQNDVLLSKEWPALKDRVVVRTDEHGEFIDLL